MKVLITTVPFGEVDIRPISLLREAGVEYVINPLGRKLQPSELAEMIKSFDVVIAGTEKIDKHVIDSAEQLKFISRVGIGLDSVDLNYAKSKGIKVSYTPDAPAPAVAELTIGLMLSLARSINNSDLGIKNREWKRYFGFRLAEMNIGIVGLGRIGSRVLGHLESFSPKEIFVNDIDSSLLENSGTKVSSRSKEFIYRNSDLITLHVPLTKATYNMISRNELSMMKSNAYLINTSRGGIVNECELYESLSQNMIAGAAIDVYEKEPYSGVLSQLSNCINTAHMGSMTVDCRSDMEIQATEEAIRFLIGEELSLEVPNYEYKNQNSL